MRTFGQDSLIKMKNELINVAEWPSGDGYRYCCIRRSQSPRHGFILSRGLKLDPDAEIEVNLGYIWDGGTGEVITYKNVNELIAAGWEID